MAQIMVKTMKLDHLIDKLKDDFKIECKESVALARHGDNVTFDRAKTTLANASR